MTRIAPLRRDDVPELDLEEGADVSEWEAQVTVCPVSSVTIACGISGASDAPEGTPKEFSFGRPDRRAA